jgi:uncharacterized protein (TIGR00290 family)
VSPRPKALLAWSSGKDSAWALHCLRQEGAVEVVGLLTTVNQTHDRVAMHAVRSELLRAQAVAVDLPLRTVPIPSPCTNADYELAMALALETARTDGITAVAFGDLFLQDVRRYREERMRDTGLAPLFPIWGIPTDVLSRRMVAAGLRARLTCVDPQQLAPRFVGREFDAELLAELPPSVDPCGEKGEFHSFAYAGPMFGHPVAVHGGEIVERDGFVFADLLPGPPVVSGMRDQAGSSFMASATNADEDAAATANPSPWRDSLCPRCSAGRRIDGRNSTFLMCTALPDKYPRQPVLACIAFRETGAPIPEET